MSEKNTDCKCSVQHYHGTTQCYRTCGCRTQECKDVNAAAVREARKKKAYGTSTHHMVDAEPVRRRLLKLMKYGWGVRAISRETKVPARTISSIVYGDKGITQKSVTAETSNRLLAFNPPFARVDRQGTSTAHINAAPAKRKLQSLAALGYSLNALAENAGYGRSYFKQILAQDQIRIDRQRAVDEVYERFWNKLPVTATPLQKRVVETSRKQAAAKGWRPPMGMAVLMEERRGLTEARAS